MTVPPWKMPWLSGGSVVVLGCGMAFSLVNMKWEGDRYAKKSCEDNYHALFFFFFSGMGTKEVQKLKGGEPTLVEMFRKHCSSKQYLFGTWNYSLTSAMRSSTATICW